MKSIVFNQNEVKAILDDRKTQTRRVIKNYNKTPLDCGRDKFYKIVDKLNNKIGLFAGFYKNSDVFVYEGKEIIDAIYFKCPYQIGDVLWVKETWNCIPLHAGLYDMPDKKPYEVVGYDYWYKADDISQNPDDKWRSSVHMPREAARIFLEVTDKWVEKLQEITEGDALDEGCKNGWEPRMNGGYITAMSNFAELWDSTIKDQDIYRYGYNANPWVINYEFKRTNCI